MGAQITTWLACTRARCARTAEYEGAQFLFGDIRWAGAGVDYPIGMVSTHSPSPRAVLRDGREAPRWVRAGQ